MGHGGPWWFGLGGGLTLPLPPTSRLPGREARAGLPASTTCVLGRGPLRRAHGWEATSGACGCSGFTGEARATCRRNVNVDPVELFTEIRCHMLTMDTCIKFYLRVILKRELEVRHIIKIIDCINYCIFKLYFLSYCFMRNQSSYPLSWSQDYPGRQRGPVCEAWPGGWACCGQSPWGWWWLTYCPCQSLPLQHSTNIS